MPTSNQSRLAVAPIILAALLCAGFTAWCNISHSPLAAAFGGLLVITLALPPLTVASDRWFDALLIWVASVCAVTLVWSFLPISWPQWGACSLVVAAFAFAVAGATGALHRIGLHAAASAAIVLVLSLAWLSWPVWMSPWLAGHQTLVNALAIGHPALAINGTLLDQGIWTERPLMYGWTALNQDVTFSMPTNAICSVALHGGIGLMCLALIAAAAALDRERQIQAARRPSI